MTKFHCFVVLIETVGNQSTIFQTNKLKDVIGASHLVYEVGTRHVLSAIGKSIGWLKPVKLDAFLKDPKRNPPIEQQGDDGVEVVVAASGKAILLTRSEARARRIIGHVTRRVLAEAPGVAARGAYQRLADFDPGGDAGGLNDVLDRVHREHAQLRSALPAFEARFQRLPFFELCPVSGLPAERESDGELVSLPVDARRKARKVGWRRIGAALADAAGKPPEFRYSVDQLEDIGSSWVGIVHADGNGLGQIFLDFKMHSKAKTARDYIEKMRAFSIAIDRCTRAATRKAIGEVWQGQKAAVIPVVLGGDDLTVICDGAQAVRFSESFLRHFEGETRRDTAVTAVKADGLTAAAGIAIVKPHFPFHRAYDLAAEGLCKSAKTLKGQGSSLDFQVLFDTSGAQLKPIRARMSVDSNPLYARPYLLHGDDWKALRGAVEVLGKKGAVGPDGRSAAEYLPRSQQHALLQATYRGAKDRDVMLARLKERYDAEAIDAVGNVSILDAMELHDIEAQGGAPTESNGTQQKVAAHVE